MKRKHLTARKRITAVLLVFCLCAIAFPPVSAHAAIFTPVAAVPTVVYANDPSERLRSAINNLVSPYTMRIDDPQFDLQAFVEAFDFTGVLEWSYNSQRSWDGYTLTWTFIWEDSHSVLAAYRYPSMERKLTNKQRTMLAACRSIMTDIVAPAKTDFEKQLAIHDYLVTHCRFDQKTADTRDVSDENPFTAYGALINGLAVCQGFTDAAALLLSMAGIENKKPESETHTWNLVKLDDGWYHMDVTWDASAYEQIGEIQYLNFNLTDAQIGRYSEHNWVNRAAIPKATATTYHYFNYHNQTATDVKELKRIITEAAANKQKTVSVWVSDHRTYAYNWQKDLKFIFDLKLNGKAVGSYSYMAPGADRDVLTVTFLP